MSVSLSVPTQPRTEWAAHFSAGALGFILRPLQFVTAVPTFLVLATLATMLLWHPEAPLYQLSRFAFGLLILGVVGRGVILRQRLFVIERIAWPMIGLTLIVLASMLSRPFDREAWSVFAAKYLIPFAMFYLAGLVFTGEKSFRYFEIFALLVLSYLSFIAIAFLMGAHTLVFPRFIVDSSLGYHTERARGPFLQAVANGVSLNMLGLLALHAYQRGSIRGATAVVLLGSVPIAILATMTRAVWLSFAGTLAALILMSGNRALRRAGFALIVIAGLALAVVLSSSDLNRALTDRLNQKEPVEFRQAVYAGSWQMFLERPLTGWGFHQIPLQLPTYVSGYRDKVLYPHNTYLEMLVESGLAGLALYLWLMFEMWQLRRAPIPPDENGGFLDRGFHRIWPILLAVYWVNAAVVVMSYQFVNALLFTMAGMLAAQRQRAERPYTC